MITSTEFDPKHVKKLSSYIYIFNHAFCFEAFFLDGR